MPIKVIKEVNNEFICKVMGIGKDAVPQGEEYYPVCGLCMNYMFDEALMLIDKGYKCTHKGYEAEEIFNIIGCSIGSMNIYIDGRKNVKEYSILVCKALVKEVAEYKEDRISAVAYDIKQMLAKDNLLYGTKFLRFLKQYLPNIYGVLTGKIMGSIDIVLKCCDMQFAKDCLKNADKERWGDEVGKLNERQMLMWTRRSFNEEMNLDCKSYADIVAMIQEETGVFSDAFMSDFAILRGIMELRYLNVWGDRIYADRPREICYEDDLDKVLDNVKVLLEKYMPDKYTFSNLLYSLVEVYPDDFDEWICEPIDCFADTDLLVMDTIYTIARKKNCELIISNTEIAGILLKWELNNNVKWSECYDEKKQRAFQDWLDRNCMGNMNDIIKH